MLENKNANFEIIEVAFKQLGWNMTPVHSLREEWERMSRELSLFKTNGDERNEWRARAEKAEAEQNEALHRAEIAEISLEDLRAERDDALRDIATMNVETVKTLLRAQKAEKILKRIANEGHANPKDAIIRLARLAIEKNNDESST